MSKMMATKSYVYNVLCDVCGFKMKSNEVRKRWDGYMVCSEDWEVRHPSDFYQTQNDTHKLPFTRPDDNNGIDVGPAVNPTTSTTPAGTVVSQL
jgi:hypothetical protein